MVVVLVVVVVVLLLTVIKPTFSTRTSVSRGDPVSKKRLNEPLLRIIVSRLFRH